MARNKHNKMEYKKIHAIFFSATGTTRKIIDTIARGCDVNEIERHDLLLKKQNLSLWRLYLEIDGLIHIMY